MNGRAPKSPPARPFISKSKFVWGTQCQKLLWVAYNDRDRLPKTDAATQAIFDQGHEVGALARSLYPGGRSAQARQRSSR